MLQKLGVILLSLQQRELYHLLSGIMCMHMPHTPQLAAVLVMHCLVICNEPIELFLNQLLLQQVLSVEVNLSP